MFAAARRDVRQWDALAPITPEDKRLLRRRVLNLAATHAITRAVSAAILFISMLFFELLAIYAWTTFGDTIGSYSNMLTSDIGWYSAMSTPFLMIFILLGLTKYFDKAYITTGLLWIGAVTPLLAAIILIAYNLGEIRFLHDSEVNSFWMSFAVSLIAIYGLTGLVVLLVNFLYGLTQTLLEARFPEAAAVHWLIATISRLDRRDASWLAVGERAAMIRAIDRAASLIRVSLFKRLRTSDQSVRAWRDQRALRVSHALREKQQWLITPKSDTSAALSERLSVLVVALLGGNWDQLEASEGEIALTAPIHRRILSLASSVLVGFLPAAIYELGRQLGWFSLGAPIDAYIQAALVVWGG